MAVAPAGASDGPLPFPRHIPFAEHLGLELWRLGDGQAELRLAVLQHQTNHLHFAHGGLVMTLLDVAMAHAARSAGVDAALSSSEALRIQGVVTIEMKTSFMRPSQGSLRAVGTLLQRTRSMAFCEGRVYDADDQLCAHATATFKYMRDAGAASANGPAHGLANGPANGAASDTQTHTANRTDQHNAKDTTT